MTRGTQTTRFRFWRSIVRFIGVIVPRRFRARWQQEWEAELEYREAMLARWDRLDWQNKLELLRRSLGAFWDALLLQPRRLEEEMFQDLRYGFRMLAKHPGFSAVAILSLALGVGANSTIFSVIQTVLLRPLPYQSPDQLVVIWETNPARGLSRSRTAISNLQDWREQSQAFQQMAQTNPGSPITVIADGIPERATCQYATPDLFPLLGVQAALGRTFQAEEVRQGTPVVLLSHAFWQRRFGSDPQIVGRTISFNSASYTVVGVLPPRFSIFNEEEPDLWRTLNSTPPAGRDSSRWLYSVARLKPGVRVAQAQTELNHIAARLEQAYPNSNLGWGVTVQPLHEGLYGNLKPFLYPLFGAVAFVLLIACTNLTNLLLARVAVRQKEIATRSALGAGRFRLLRQFLTESLALALPSSVLGLLLAYWGIGIFSLLAPTWFPLRDQITIDRSVLGFTLLLSVLAAVISACIPAWQATKTNLSESLKGSGKDSGSGKRRRLRSLLVVSEVALALVLLVGAGLMLNSLLRLHNVHPGFAPENLLTMEISLAGKKYWDSAPGGLVNITPAVTPFFQQALERIQSLPEVKEAGMISWLPTGPQRGRRLRRFSFEGRPATGTTSELEAGYNAVSPEYFQVMKIPLLRGRYLTARDTEEAPWAVVISETLARRYWPGEDPIGKRLTLNIVSEERPREVVGVVGDVRQVALAVEPEPELYVHYPQQPPRYTGDAYQGRIHMSLVLRATAPAAIVVQAVRTTVAQLDEAQPVYGVQTLEQSLASSVAPWRFYSLLLGCFAGLALLLAVLGIYGVISYSVVERSQEIGIRMALGARPRDVLRLVLRQALTLVAAGLAVGVVASYIATRAIANLLFGIKSYDPVTYLAVSLILLGVACLAVFWPARRATKVDPLIALRCD
jgi:putative ABC transport system permease protein